MVRKLVLYFLDHVLTRRKVYVKVTRENTTDTRVNMPVGSAARSSFVLVTRGDDAARQTEVFRVAWK